MKVKHVIELLSCLDPEVDFHRSGDDYGWMQIGDDQYDTLGEGIQGPDWSGYRTPIVVPGTPEWGELLDKLRASKT